MKKYFILFFLATVGYGCSDFLEVEPDEQVSISEQLSSRQGVLQAAAGVYVNLEELMSSDIHFYPGILGGNMSFSPSVSDKELRIFARVAQVYNFNDTEAESDFENFYEESYDVINQTNLLLERLANFDFLSTNERDQLQAELLAIRAFVHFHLTQVYAQDYSFTTDASHLGIVYNTEVLDIGTDFPSRSSMAEVYRFLKNDLEQAISLFTGQQLLAGPQNSYFNSQTTTAVFAKIALQMNDWQTAADLSDQLINTSDVSLTPTSEYLAQWNDVSLPSETVFQFTAPLDDGEVSSSVSEIFAYFNDVNYGRIVASGDLLQLFAPGDIRAELYQPQQLEVLRNGTIVTEDFYFTTKYPADSGIPYLRLSELYLIYAEASERLMPGDPLALSRLNDIRERAGLSRLTTSNNLLEEIFLERRRELAFESALFYDIKRYQKDVNRNLDCIAALCDINYPSNFYVLPIPISSISTNENMIQNEGY
ncbi:RagB/SusD family nutrient uptake outer membrane protein [Nonlabens xiamenensis]|uniref:RagB/SusD family nutrient uptake outer membrane protein n=1 Tax=Nonlabens xiamenensis TaxID=2341043 RepID=UPI000F605E21|nr:RagB/SusD family nutrient uptake outer membrane protein [Nonlabens xiamenensis]